MLCRSAVYAGMRCPSVRLSVTFVSCVKTNKDVLEFFSPSGSQTILVFPCQTGWRYSDGNPTNGGVECRWGRQKTRFWTIVWLRCIQVDSVVNRTSRKLWKTKPRRRASSQAPTRHCWHKTTTKCLWRARRYTSERRSNLPGHNPLGNNPRFLLP